MTCWTSFERWIASGSIGRIVAAARRGSLLRLHAVLERAFLRVRDAGGVDVAGGDLSADAREILDAATAHGARRSTSCGLWPLAGEYTVTLHAVGQAHSGRPCAGAEFGFVDVVVSTHVQTPHRCGRRHTSCRPLPDLRPGVASFSSGPYGPCARAVRSSAFGAKAVQAARQRTTIPGRRTGPCTPARWRRRPAGDHLAVHHVEAAPPAPGCRRRRRCAPVGDVHHVGHRRVGGA